MSEAKLLKDVKIGERFDVPGHGPRTTYVRVETHSLLAVKNKNDDVRRYYVYMDLTTYTLYASNDGEMEVYPVARS